MYLIFAKLQLVSLKNGLGKIYLAAYCTRQGDMAQGHGDVVLVLISISLPWHCPHWQSQPPVPSVSCVLPLPRRSGDHALCLSVFDPGHPSPQEATSLGCVIGLLTTIKVLWTEGTVNLQWLFSAM